MGTRSTRRGRRALISALAPAVLLLVLAGLSGTARPAAGTSGTAGRTVHPVVSAPTSAGALAELPARGAAPAAERARALLATIPVRVEDTGAHYNRDEWGDWTSSRGCDTRETVLIRDGHHVRTGSGCRVLSGTWPSPYDGATLTDPRRVDVDHRVPAAEAQRSGARDWTRTQRAAFFNDATNLAAVSAAANRSKGDDDPGRWRPSRRDAWCSYATAYITTKHSYRLHVDPAEHAALTAMLATCPGGPR